MSAQSQTGGIPHEHFRILQAIHELEESDQFESVPFFMILRVLGFDFGDTLEVEAATRRLIRYGYLRETTAEAVAKQAIIHDGRWSVNLNSWPKPDRPYALPNGQGIVLRYQRVRPPEAPEPGEWTSWLIEARDEAASAGECEGEWQPVAAIIADEVAGNGGRLFQLTDQGREALRQAWAEQVADVRASAGALAEWLRAHVLSGRSGKTLAPRAVSEASERIVELFNKAALTWANLQRESKGWLNMLLDVLGVQTLEEGMVGCWVEACLTKHKRAPDKSILSAQALADDAAKLADFLDTLDRLAGIQKPGGQATDEPPAGGDIGDKSRLSAPEIAARFDLNAETVRKRLERWRKNHGDGWHDLPNPGPNEPRVVYELAAVRPVIDSLLSKPKTSAQRPAK